MKYTFIKQGWSYVINNENQNDLYLFRPQTKIFKNGWLLIRNEDIIFIQMLFSVAQIIYYFQTIINGKKLFIKRKSFFSSYYNITYGEEKYFVYIHWGCYRSIYKEDTQVGYFEAHNNIITLVCNNNEEKLLMLIITGTIECNFSGQNDINIGTFTPNEKFPFNHSWIPSN